MGSLPFTFCMVLLCACRQDETRPYTGVLGYWTADARARARGWNCEGLGRDALDCNGTVGDTVYQVLSDSTGTVLRVQKRWRVPPGRLLRHLQLLTNDLSSLGPGRRCDPRHPERLMWRASGYRIELLPEGDSAGYVLQADTILRRPSPRDTLPCPAA